MEHIYGMSPEMQERLKSKRTYPGSAYRKYPFDLLEVGQSFITNQSNKNVCTRVGIENKKGDKKYDWLNHKDKGFVEVTRIE